MSPAFRVECPHCGESNSLLRVLFHVSGVHLRCRSCHRGVRVVGTVSGVFLAFLSFAVAYGAVFWWLSGTWSPDTWEDGMDPLYVVTLPLLAGVVGALTGLAVSRHFGGAAPPDPPLSKTAFGASYGFALVSTVALLLAIIAGGLLLRMGEPMPAPSMPDAPEPVVVEGLADWSFTELGGAGHTIGALKGTPVFMHCWRPGDPGVVDVLASIKRLRKSESQIYYVLLGDSDESTVRAFAAERGPSLPYVIAAEPLPPGLSSLRSPTDSTTYFLDAQGRLGYSHSGAARWDTDGVRRFIDQLR